MASMAMACSGNPLRIDADSAAAAESNAPSDTACKQCQCPVTGSDSDLRLGLPQHGAERRQPTDTHARPSRHHPFLPLP